LTYCYLSLNYEVEIMATLFSGNRILGAKSLMSSYGKQELPLEKKLQIQTGYQLLENRKYRTLMEQCNELLDFTNDQKETYLVPLVHAFAEFVQQLPETRNSYFCKPGGFMEHALMRTTSALSMCRAYFSSESPEKNKHRLSATETLWMYTLFAACIFNGIGKVFSDMTIELYDSEKKHIDRWTPFEAGMLQTKASYYDYDYEEARHADLFSRRVSVLLAKQLIPFKGFAWISSDKEALSLWLALLEDNPRDAGTLGPFLIRADALAINTFFDEKRLQREYMVLDPEARDEIDLLSKEKEEQLLKELEEKEKFIITDKDKSFFRNSRDRTDKANNANRIAAEKRNPNTQAGIEFLKWLTNQFKAEQITFNTEVFYLPTGLIFLPTALFEEFKKKFQYHLSTDDIIASFNRLQLQTKGEGSNNLHAFIKQTVSAQSKMVESKKMQGIILSNPQIVLPRTVVIAQQNGTKQHIKTTELQNHLQALVPLIPVSTTVAQQATPIPATESLTVEANVKNFFTFGK
jgi:hypothetical protein